MNQSRPPEVPFIPETGRYSPEMFAYQYHRLRGQYEALIEGTRAAVHWRVDIHSKITGIVVPTELVDVVEVSGGKVSSYKEFFAPS